MSQSVLIQLTKEDVALQEWFLEEKPLVAIITGLFDPAAATDEASLASVAAFVDDVVNTCRRDALEYQQFATPNLIVNQLLAESSVASLLGHLFAEGSTPAALEHGISMLLSYITEPAVTDEGPPLSAADIQRHHDGERHAIPHGITLCCSVLQHPTRLLSAVVFCTTHATYPNKSPLPRTRFIGRLAAWCVWRPCS